MIIGVTMGDPTGVGPEIIAGALQEAVVLKDCQPVVIGRVALLRQALKLVGSDQEVLPIERLERSFIEALPSTGLSKVVYCYEAGPSEADFLPPGQISAFGGAAAHDALVAGAKAALAGELDAIVTAPLHKGALHMAGHDWPGHTELLASLCKVDQFAMMLYLPPSWKNEGTSQDSNRECDAKLEVPSVRTRGGAAGLGVVHVTLHMALREVFEHLNQKSIFETIELAQNTFTKLRISLGLPPCPALAVAALNPHCGEGGLFGDEETRLIAPAVSQARGLGWNVSGPLSVDTLMPAAAAGHYDAVIAMYHDQGHIALKLLDMFDAVNITLGIPIIRTSVAHGTAHDIAWRGIAKSSGMTQAIMTAVRLAKGAKVSRSEHAVEATQVVSHIDSCGA